MASERKPLRVWPGVALVSLQWLLRFGIPLAVPDWLMAGMLGMVACAVGILIWWLFFSRAPVVDRLGALVVLPLALLATKQVVDVSIATGAMGYLLYFLALPFVCLAFVAWAALTRNLAVPMRRATGVAAIAFACGLFTLVKTGGFTASFQNDLHWRWAKTPEERLLEQTHSLPAAPAPEPVQPERVAAPAAVPETATITAVKTAAIKNVPEAPKETVEPGDGEVAAWPGFRGPHRDDVVSGVRIQTDWTASPPVAMWRRPIGPGWSSFAVHGDYLFTQEQRGPEEIVSCYRVSTGQPVWAHRDAARFWESNGGAGPRGTPTLDGGRVYTFGATGIVNVLRAHDGSVVWSRNAAAELGAKTPQWGFASSPLVAGGLAIVAVAGQLVAYDRETGKRRWTGPEHGVSYSSPQLATIDGVPQVILLSEAGATSVAVSDGKLLWEHPWPGYPIVQPASTGDGDVLISVSDHSGMRRLAVTQGPSGWTAAERWTSNGLKPYFNDFVVHNGFAYGFDGSILSCIDLADGHRRWKGGRYGNGQLILLAEQDLMLITSEEGELALVKATPEHFSELARVPAIEGKTWNHPVLAGGVLLVRNGQEMAAFRVPLAE